MKMLVFVVANQYQEYVAFAQRHCPKLMFPMLNPPLQWIPAGERGWNRAAGYVEGTLYFHLSGELHPDFKKRFVKIAVAEDKR